jgi:hypothetical protein
MNETRFRSLMQQALGDEAIQPWLASAVRTRLAEPPAAVAPNRLPLLVAAALIVVVTAAAWFVPQYLNPRSTKTGVPAASPSPSQVAVDPSGCKLPVLLANGQPGFIDTSSAGFLPDRTTPGIPAVSHSRAVGRWLPVPYSQVSPDGRSYAWLNGRQLHVTDVATGHDKALWTAAFDVYIWRWDDVGIRLGDTPLYSPASQRRTWVVDPGIGAITQGPATLLGGVFEPLPGDPHGTDGTSFHPLGSDAQGRFIWWFFNLDKPGAVDWVFYETAPGQRVYIYKGTQGDAAGFDPDMAFGDATGVWFLDRIHNTIWHWQPGGELTKVQPASRAAMVLVATIAGPCF